MLVNLQHFFRAVTDKPEETFSTNAMVNALARWNIPMVIPDNLPNGARKHRKVDIALLDKAKAAYAHEKEAAARQKQRGTVVRAPAVEVLKRPPKKEVAAVPQQSKLPLTGPYTPYPPGPKGSQYAPSSPMHAQMNRIELMVEALLDALGVKV